MMASEIDDDVIDVVVPVFNNFDDSNRLFESLAATCGTARFALKIVDDCSTADGALRPPPVSERLIEVSLVRNDPNRGFAASVNRALAGSRRDVVILNTDTLVFGDWLDRLRAAAATHRRIATVTPFSTAATILSYPTFVKDHVGTLETGWAALDAMCADIAAAPVEIPTGIGFCMLMRRACLDEIGLLDDKLFGSGYGEESDFCRRAVEAGWINVAAPNVFVWHRGSGSFGTRTRSLRDDAERRLRARHADYEKVVARFIRQDVLRPLRSRLDGLRVASKAWRLDLASAPTAGTIGLAQVDGGWPTSWRASVDGVEPLPNLPLFTRFTGRAVIARFLADIGVSSIADGPNSPLPRGLRRRFLSAARSLGVAIV